MKLTEQQRDIASNLFISRMADYKSPMGGDSKALAISFAKRQAMASITFAKIYTETEEDHDAAQDAMLTQLAPQLTEPPKNKPVMETGLEPEPEKPNVVDKVPGTVVKEEVESNDDDWNIS